MNVRDYGERVSRIVQYSDVPDSQNALWNEMTSRPIKRTQTRFRYKTQYVARMLTSNDHKNVTDSCVLETKHLARKYWRKLTTKFINDRHQSCVLRVTMRIKKTGHVCLTRDACFKKSYSYWKKNTTTNNNKWTRVFKEKLKMC
jgi:hypothetical protein